MFAVTFELVAHKLLQWRMARRKSDLKYVSCSKKANHAERMGRKASSLNP